METKKLRRISLRIGSKDPMPFTIPADTDAEKHLRQGAGEVNRLLSKYRAAYPEVSDEEVMTLVAIHLANDLAAFRDEYSALRLSDTLSEILSEIDHAEMQR